MARFTQYPAASIGDYADATTFLIANSDGEIKQASLDGLRDSHFCGIKCISVTIPSADVLQLNSSPYTLIEAQGANTVIDVVSAFYQVDYQTTPYATNTTLYLRFNGTTSAVGASSNGLTINDNTPTKIGLKSASDVTTKDMQINQPLLKREKFIE